MIDNNNKFIEETLADVNTGDIDTNCIIHGFGCSQS